MASTDQSLIFSCNKKFSGRQAVVGWQPLKEVIEDQGPLHLNFPSSVSGFHLHGCKMAIIPLGIKLKKKEGQRTKGAYYFSGLIRHLPRSPIWLFWLRCHCSEPGHIVTLHCRAVWGREYFILCISIV